MKIVTKDLRDIECKFFTFRETDIEITRHDNTITHEDIINLDYVSW